MRWPAVHGSRIAEPGIATAAGEGLSFLRGYQSLPAAAAANVPGFQVSFLRTMVHMASVIFSSLITYSGKLAYGPRGQQTEYAGEPLFAQAVGGRIYTLPAG